MTLRTKMTGVFFVLALGSGGLILGLSGHAVTSVMTRQVAETGMLKMSDLSEELVPAFELSRESLLLPLLQEAQDEMQAVYVAALDVNGRVIAHTNVADKGVRYTDPLSLRILQDEHPGAQVVRHGKEWVMEAWSPVWAKPATDANEEFLLGGTASVGTGSARRLGTVRIALPMRYAKHVERRIVQQLIGIVTGIGVLAFLFALAIVRNLLGPIRQLASGTQHVVDGQYDICIPTQTTDELGDLVRRFNHMLQVLRETTVSKNFLGSILSHMSDPLIVIDMDGSIQMVNQATERLLGYTAQELKGTAAQRLWAESSGNVEALDRPSDVRNVEVELTTKKGEKIPVLFSRSFIQEGETEATGMIAVAKDMTERKRLESIVRQSDKMSAVGQLAAGVAHEINNPLGVILGFAQAVVRRLEPNNPFEMPLRSIEKEAVRCRNLVQDLLTFSRTSKADREPIDINRAVEGAFSLVMAQARMTHATVRKELTADLPRIMGNLNQIQQVVINLANNAMDAIGKEKGEIVVRTDVVKEGSQAWVRMRVTDNGPGIPSDILPRIFEPFFTTKPVGKGTGLGLSLVHEIVQKHAGMLDIQSRPGATEFSIRFPARTTPPAVGGQPLGRNDGGMRHE